MQEAWSLVEEQFGCWQRLPAPLLSRFSSVTRTRASCQCLPSRGNRPALPCAERKAWTPTHSRFQISMAHMRDQLASLLFSLLLVQGIHTALGNLQCEDLPVEDCAFAVSSSGARCVLEKYVAKEGGSRLECQTSIIMAEKRYEWIESDECVKSCGLERMSFGLSTDALLENEFTQKLCSSACQQSCSNIVDLYTKLAAGEGVYLPHLCKAQKEKEKSKEEVSLKLISENEKLVAEPPTSPTPPSSEEPGKGTSQGVGGATPWTAPAAAPWVAGAPAPAPY